MPKETNGNESEDEELTEKEKERKYTTDFTDEDYLSRLPSTRFAKLKLIEN